MKVEIDRSDDVFTCAGCGRELPRHRWVKTEDGRYWHLMCWGKEGVGIGVISDE